MVEKDIEGRLGSIGLLNKLLSSPDRNIFKFCHLLRRSYSPGFKGFTRHLWISMHSILLPFSQGICICTGALTQFGVLCSSREDIVRSLQHFPLGLVVKMGDFSQKDFEKLRKIASHPNADPNLKRTLRLYEELVFNNPAKMLQDETDRRWRIMVEAEQRVPEDEKPKTMGAHRDQLLKFGFRLNKRIPKELESKECHVGEFFDAYGSGGTVMLVDYEMKNAPNAKPICDECKKDASLRCRQCGEHYCSKECQRKAWPGHKRACKLIAAERANCSPF